MYELCEALVNKLKEKNLTLSCAESCTGGLIAKSIIYFCSGNRVFSH